MRKIRKEMTGMILITILLLTLLILSLVVIAGISAIGASAIIIFGDVIVCGLFIGWLIKKIWSKKKRR